MGDGDKGRGGESLLRPSPPLFSLSSLSLAPLHMSHVPAPSRSSFTLPPSLPPSPYHTLSAPRLLPLPSQSQPGGEKRVGVLSLPFLPSPARPPPVLTPVPPAPLIPLPLLALEAAVAARQRSDPALLLLTNRQIRKQSVNSEGVKAELTSK